MTRTLVLRHLVTLLILTGSYTTFAQDSVKKAPASIKKPAAARTSLTPVHGQAASHPSGSSTTTKYTTPAPGAGVSRTAPSRTSPHTATPVSGSGITQTPSSPARTPYTTSTPPITGSAPLPTQYNDMLMRSRTQEGYKVINPNRLTALWKNTMDTLNTERKKRMEAEKKLTAALHSSSSMRDSLDRHQEVLDQTQDRINEISFLGIPVDKSLYNSIMWGAVVILLLAVVISVFQSSRYRKEATYRIKLFEELSGEFQTYKTKANEREKKLARELQDERNKLDELLNGNNS